MWTAERILALAPDPASAKAGQGLSSPRKWVSHGHNEHAIWGECQGSAKDPYRTQIDLSEPAFKCNCPSRKFPCKHALGLFLMLGASAGTGKDVAPDWVSEWLGSRGEKAARKQEKLQKAAEGVSTVDPEAQAKRAAERMAKISAGVEDLSRWMQDLLRQGLAQASGGAVDATEKFWREPAARLVDAQAPGLGRMVREVGDATATGQGWQERAVRKLTRLFLTTEAFRRLEQLPAELQADVNAMVGIPLKEEELFRLAAIEPAKHVVADTWTVAGQRTEEEDNLRTQRSWLIGHATGRYALVLEFAFGGQPLKSTLVMGSQFSGELIFYPSAHPLRATIKSRTGSTSEAKVYGSAFPTISAALDAYSSAIGRNPLIELFPMALSEVRIAKKDQTLAVDAEGRALRLRGRGEGGDWSWQLAAMSGGHPLHLFGEWEGHSLTPLSVVTPPPEEVLYAIG